MKLEGKTILVTAAGQGIGKASALSCAAEGAKVIAADLNADTLAALKIENPAIETCRLDVTDTEAVEALAAELPPLDGLFNCVGYVHHGTVLDLDDESFALSMQVNVGSMVRMCRSFLPGLLARADATGAASIVNMSSMCSSVKGFVNRAAYGTTKAAVIGLTKSIAVDFVTKGLRCNAICPGTVDTPSLRGRIAASDDPVQAEKDFIARQPMGRLAQVEDIAPMLVYLMSDDSRFVTGQALLVDGGVTI